MPAGAARSWYVTMMTAGQPALWDDAIRDHDQRVFVSLLALGLSPDHAREIAQATWTRLMEQFDQGKLEDVELPGLAIRQARFLALSALRKQASEERFLEAVPIPSESEDVERRAIDKQNLALAIAALRGCSPSARRLFGLIYNPPHLSHAEAARDLGISVQRVRQILCETRKALRTALEDAR